MDGLFENIFYLIPIAIIVIRVINAVGGGKRRSRQQQSQQSQNTSQNQQRNPQGQNTAQNQQRNPQGQDTAQKKISREEFIRKIREAQGIPDTPKPQPAPKPAAQIKKVVPHWEVESKKKKPAAQKPKQNEYHALFPTEAFRHAENLRQNPSGQAAAGSAAKQGLRQEAPTTQKSTAPGMSMPGLSPLQQAFVWSEILGQPKSFSL